MIGWRKLVVRSLALLFAASAQGAGTLAIEDLGEGVFQFGDIRIDKGARAVTFPAAINMDEGMVEYFCVSELGRTHESLLSTGVVPQHIHAALLLVGNESEIPDPGSAEETGTVPAGCPVSISIGWENGGEKILVSASTLLQHTKTMQSPP